MLVLQVPVFKITIKPSPHEASYTQLDASQLTTSNTSVTRNLNHLERMIYDDGDGENVSYDTW